MAIITTGNQVRQRDPKFKAGKDGSIFVRHREIIAEVQGTSLFTATKYPIQPGLGYLFPWLSRIALNYEKYKIKKCRFEYINSINTGHTGNVVMAIDYDASDATPTNLQAIMNNKSAVMGPAYVCSHLDFAQSGGNKAVGSQFYVRGNALPANEDIKLSDVGNFFFATSGHTNSLTIGTIWVDYEVELITPENDPDAAAYDSNKFVSGGVLTQAQWLGSSPVKTGPGLCSVEGNSTLVFDRPGEYFIAVWLESLLPMIQAPTPFNIGDAITTVLNEVQNTTVQIINLRCKTNAFKAGMGLDWTLTGASPDISNARVMSYSYILN